MQCRRSLVRLGEEVGSSRLGRRRGSKRRRRRWCVEEGKKSGCTVQVSKQTNAVSQESNTHFSELNIVHNISRCYVVHTSYKLFALSLLLSLILLFSWSTHLLELYSNLCSVTVHLYSPDQARVRQALRDVLWGNVLPGLPGK